MSILRPKICFVYGVSLASSPTFTRKFEIIMSHRYIIHFLQYKYFLNVEHRTELSVENHCLIPWTIYIVFILLGPNKTQWENEIDAKYRQNKQYSRNHRDGNHAEKGTNCHNCESDQGVVKGFIQFRE